MSPIEFLRRYPVIPAFIIALLLFTAVAETWILPHNPERADLRVRHTPPFWMEHEDASISYFLGTDALGRDILSKIIAGARITVLVVIAAVGTGIIVGTTIGLGVGLFRGDYR